jgi:hypothetical protein
MALKPSRGKVMIEAEGSDSQSAVLFEEPLLLGLALGTGSETQLP